MVGAVAGKCCDSSFCTEKEDEGLFSWRKSPKICQLPQNLRKILKKTAKSCMIMYKAFYALFSRGVGGKEDGGDRNDIEADFTEDIRRE